MGLTRSELEKFIIDKGNPSIVILSPEDWQIVYDAYKSTNRDEQGVYVLAVNTKVYSAVPAAGELDLSDTKIWVDK